MVFGLAKEAARNWLPEPDSQFPVGTAQLFINVLPYWLCPASTWLPDVFVGAYPTVAAQMIIEERKERNKNWLCLMQLKWLAHLLIMTLWVIHNYLYFSTKLLQQTREPMCQTTPFNECELAPRVLENLFPYNGEAVWI